MSLEHDPRTGQEDSAHVSIASGDGNTPQTAYDVPDDALFKVTDVKIEYNDSASAQAELEMHDNADGTSNANLDDQRDKWENLDSSGVRVETSGNYRPFENAVLFATAGNQDSNIEVTVHGVLLTDIADVSGM